jgi:hypothetical protein
LGSFSTCKIPIAEKITSKIAITDIDVKAPCALLAKI